ncbi:MAG: type II toxin-antitoxin system prevent-host-death family antitoxin [Actinomycetia bacterium]|nr:type II toxin-antitoxin system prevent-host-death family antitoxin [Actinomycetes bacterium]
MTTVGIRLLKSRLSEYVNRTRRGEVVVVTDRGKPVARLEPLDPADTAAWRERAAQWGVAWQGGKPRGIPLDAAPVLRPDQTLARAVEEDR